MQAFEGFDAQQFIFFAFTARPRLFFNLVLAYNEAFPLKVNHNMNKVQSMHAVLK